MIPQNKINEAAREYALIKNNEHEIAFMLSKSDFKAGVQFALNEIQPLMVEFAEEIIGDGWILRADGWQNVMDYKVPELERRTTQQLLEEFIKSKNK